MYVRLGGNFLPIVAGSLFHSRCGRGCQSSRDHHGLSACSGPNVWPSYDDTS